MELEIFKNPINLGYYVFLITYYIFIFSLCIKILLEQKDPSKTIGYILVLLFIPVFGLIVYQLFGQNLRKEKLFNRKAFSENIQLNQIITQSNFEFHRNFEDLNLHLAHGKKLANLLRNNDKAFLTKHN
jgi:cardiolipin synthase A/B